MNSNDKVNSLGAIQSSLYVNIDLDHLVMYAVGELENLGVDLSFENISVACFKLFPSKFTLLGYPIYPDVKRTHDCLFRCTYKTKQWLGGKTAQGFIITERSRIFIQEAKDLLKGKTTQRVKADSKTRRKEAIISSVTQSIAYLKFQDENRENISNAEICFMLQCTLDSAPETLSRNLKSLKLFTAELENKNLYDFLCWVEKQFNFLFGKHL